MTGVQTCALPICAGGTNAASGTAPGGGSGGAFTASGATGEIQITFH